LKIAVLRKGRVNLVLICAAAYWLSDKRMRNPMARKYKYAGKASTATSASGKKGILIRSLDTFFFRVYHADHTFTDYEIRHDDLSITIDSDSLASFYTHGQNHVLDHTPDVLGLEPIEQNGNDKETE
jgi:hypothetical protein